MKPKSELILYQTEDNRTRIEVRLENETVWLTQAQLAELFQTTIPNVSMHIRNILAEGELQAGSVVKEFLTTAADGRERTIARFNYPEIPDSSTGRCAAASWRMPGRTPGSRRKSRTWPKPPNKSNRPGRRAKG
jgi:hypothetical protein